MKCVICGQPIEEGRRQGQPPLLAKYCLKCRAERRRHARVKLKQVSFRSIPITFRISLIGCLSPRIDTRHCQVPGKSCHLNRSTQHHLIS